jgi:hypothetical protein
VPAFAVPADFAALERAPVLLVVAALAAATFTPVVFFVVTPAARLAAGLVVALFATAIVISPLSETFASRSAPALQEHLRLFSVPAGVLRIPSLVSFSYSVDCMLGRLGRCVRSESVHRGADVVACLDAVM